MIRADWQTDTLHRPHGKADHYHTPLTLDEQFDLIWALRSAKLRIARLQKCMDELTYLCQEMIGDHQTDRPVQ